MSRASDYDRRGRSIWYHTYACGTGAGSREHVVPNVTMQEQTLVCEPLLANLSIWSAQEREPGRAKTCDAERAAGEEGTLAHELRFESPVDVGYAHVFHDLASTGRDLL